MTLPVLAQVADAVTAELNSETWAMEFTALRSYLPRVKLEDLGTLHVSVVPVAEDIEASARDLWQHDFTVDVAIQMKPADITNASLDPLLLLAEAFADHFARVLRLPTLLSACWIRTERMPVLDYTHLDSSGVLTAVTRLTFRVGRS